MTETSKFFACIALSLLLAACAGGPSYRAAERDGGYGYSDSQLAENRYRVSYVLRGDDAGAAREMALLRAAELTLLNGHDWFEVASNDVVQDGERRAGTSTVTRMDQTTTSCGLLSCRSTTRPSYHTGVSVTTGPDRQRTSAHLEFVMGSGTAPGGASVYQAKELADTLRPRHG